LRIGDQHNSRTFQIAACGGAMMMAQRTDEHVELFCEDKEAVYFDSVAELRDKLAYWLSPARDDLRRSIAAAARGRCMSEDYSYVPVARRFLQHFGLPVVDVP
jgi:spore maturation protein CgeB